MLTDKASRPNTIHEKMTNTDQRQKAKIGNMQIYRTGAPTIDDNMISCAGLVLPSSLGLTPVAVSLCADDLRRSKFCEDFLDSAHEKRRGSICHFIHYRRRLRGERPTVVLRIAPILFATVMPRFSRKKVTILRFVKLFSIYNSSWSRGS